MEIKKIYNSIFKKLNNFGKNNKTDINPPRCWKTVIFVFVSGVIFVSILNLYFFQYLNKIEFKEEIKTENNGGIKKSDLEKVINTYNGKKEKFNELLNSIEIMESKSATTSITR